MHVRSKSSQFNHYLFILAINLTTAAYLNDYDLYQTDVVPKCCRAGYLFNESFVCVEQSDQNVDEEATGNSDKSRIVTNVVGAASECQYYRDETVINPLSETAKNEQEEKKVTHFNLYVTINLCNEDMTNGTKVLAKCSEVGTRGVGDRTPSSPLPSATSKEITALNYSSSLATVVFWGAKTYMATNIAHVVLCIAVVVVYLSVPDLGRGLYNRAVLRHNVSLMMHGCVLILLAYYDRDNRCILDTLTVFLWIVMQFFTNATIFWLNVICFDMTLAITRLRWMPATTGHQRIDPEEDRRLFLYGIFAWGTALVPAIIAAICEYVPGVPRNFIFKPNYIDYHAGRSVVVSMYFFLLPLLTMLLNNVLFLYTTYKIIRIQRNIETAMSNHKNMLRKKYFLFLRLYLLMGAPWFFGALFACLNKLFILKLCRLIQPILWLLMLTTHQGLKKKIVGKIPFMKSGNKPVHVISI